MLHSHVTCCCRFAVRLEFRALQPSGLLLYTASSSINPANFFALFLQHGYLYVSMETGDSAVLTKNVRTNENSYANGEWWTVGGAMHTHTYLLLDYDVLSVKNLAVFSKIFCFTVCHCSQVEVLRINNFIAIIVENNSDYVNNGADSLLMTSLLVTTPLYVGGVAQDVIQNSAPFQTQSMMNQDTTSFHGCVRSLQVTVRQLEYISLPLE